MPIVSKHSPWELSFRKQVRALATGWNVVEARGRIRLKVRPPGLSEQSVVLPFRWVETDVGDAYVRIRNISKLMAGGLDLRTAALQADGNAPQVVRDWKGAVERFQQQKLNHGNTISVATWNKAYQPVLDMSVLLLNGPTPPGRPVDLIDRCVADWEPGSRMRQIRCQSLAQYRPTAMPAPSATAARKPLAMKNETTSRTARLSSDVSEWGKFCSVSSH